MKVKIDNITYVLLLISFLAGYFEYMYLFLIVIFIHEAGHVFFSYLVNLKVSKIIIYPFGGLTILNEDLNVNTNKELFVLFGGIIFQLLFYFLIFFLYKNLYITNHVFIIIKHINIILISFNFLPILPLDGGKIINIILDKMFSYKVSNIICIFVSIIFIIIFSFKSKTYLSIILTIFLLKCIIIEIQNLKIKYYQFLLERYLNNYQFKKFRFINDKNKFKRDYYHFINGIKEKEFLKNLFI